MNKSKTKKNENTQKKSRGVAATLFTKIILRIVGIAVLAIALFFGGNYLFGKFTQVQIEKKRMMAEHELLESAELVLYKMRYSDIIAIKKKRGLSSAYSLARYSGIIRVGIEDFSQAEITLSPDGKTLMVKIPPTTMLGNEITNQEIFDEKQGVFAKITTQEIFEEISAAKEEAVTEFLNDGLLEEADARAALVIKQLLSPIGFESIIVEKNQ